MTVAKVELRCPFCRTVLAPHVVECHRCHAKRRTRRGLSPVGFHLFVAAWLGLAAPLVLGAFYIGFAPWMPSGTPPPYALALVGAKTSAAELVRCRVEVVEPGRRTTVQVLNGACNADPGSAQAGASPAQAPSLTERRVAAALHTLLSLLAGLSAAWGLLPLVRFAFLRKSNPSWVRRAAA